MKNHKKIVFFILFSMLFTQSANAQIAALDYATNPLYNPNHIISDTEMTDYTAMSLDEIKDFLNSKPGRLKNYEIITPLGLNKSAAQIIYESAVNNKINPKVLLVLLQKEQSLIENPNPSQYALDWATGYGRCDDCSLDASGAPKNKGFGKQVDNAASFFRYCIDNNATQTWLKRAGLIYSIDSIPVIPTNIATASLYTYTPHFYGNYNFWKIWQRWFTNIETYPDGLLMQIKGTDEIYLIKDGKLFSFKNKAVFLSRFKPKNVIQVDKASLENYKTGPIIKFLNYSVVKTEAKKTYLLVDDKKRLIDKEAFRYYGFDPDEVLAAKETDIDYYTEGVALSVKAKYPLGILMQDSKTGGIFFVVDSIKYPVWDKAMIKINFPTRKLIKTTATNLKKYTTGDPIIFNDGTWLKTKDSPEIYLISNGTRRLIKDEITFETLGGKQQTILTVSEQVMTQHPIGETIALSAPTVAAATTTSTTTASLTISN